MFQPEEQRTSTDPAALLDELAHRAAGRRTETLNKLNHNLLRDISRYLIALDFGGRSDRRLAVVWGRLHEWLPALDRNLQDIQMERREFGFVPILIRNGVRLEFHELSDGYQALLVVIFDLLLRYAFLFPTGDPWDGEALVAIDEVDLHLHPRWQRTVVEQLTQLFPKTQFVLTTHSPVVVQGAIDLGMTVITLREDGAVTPKPLSPIVARRLRGAEIGSLLFDDHLFDVESRYSTAYSEIDARIDELQANIGRGIATDDDYAELSRLLAELENLVVREDERRADGSALAQMTKHQAAFAKDLLAELRRAKS
ncbi:MAG: AAA family ATPase [Bryobacteraceae bacterium]